jgi:hypothetical protein
MLLRKLMSLRPGINLDDEKRKDCFGFAVQRDDYAGDKK